MDTTQLDPGGLDDLDLDCLNDLEYDDLENQMNENVSVRYELYDEQKVSLSARLYDEYSFDFDSMVPTRNRSVGSGLFKQQSCLADGFLTDDIDDGVESDHDKDGTEYKYESCEVRWRESYIRANSVKFIPEETTINELRSICDKAIIRFPMIDRKGVGTWNISARGQGSQSLFIGKPVAHMIQTVKVVMNPEGAMPGLENEVHAARRFKGYCDYASFSKYIDFVSKNIKSPYMIGEYHERILCCLPMIPFLDCDVKRKEIGFSFSSDSVLVGTIVSLLDIGWIHASNEMGMKGTIDPPNVYYCTRESKVSLHVHGKRNGYICRDITYLAKFVRLIQRRMRMIAETYPDGIVRNVAEMLGKTRDGWIDEAMINTKREQTCGLRMPFSPKKRDTFVYPNYGDVVNKSQEEERKKEIARLPYDFTAQLKLWDRPNKSTKDCEYMPETFIIQPFDFIWDEHAYGSLKQDTKNVSTVDIADPELKCVTEKFIEKFPEYVPTGKNGPHAAMILDRIVGKSTFCKAHGKDHKDRNAFIVKRINGERYEWQLICCGHTGEPSKVIHRLPCNQVVEQTSTTSIIKYRENAIVGDWKYMYGEGGAIPSWPAYSLDPNTPEGKFWTSDLFIRAPFGAGKTTAMRKLVEGPRNYSAGILMVTSRVSFSAKLCREFGFFSYKKIKKDNKFDPMNNPEHRQVVCQFESLHKVTRIIGDKFKFGLVIIDEPCALFSHMFSRFCPIGSNISMPAVTFGKAGVDYYALFESVLSPKNSQKIVVMDNDISDFVIDAFRSVRSEKEFQLYINENKRYSHVSAFIDDTPEGDCRVTRKFLDFVRRNLNLALDGLYYSGCVMSVHRRDEKVSKRSSKEGKKKRKKSSKKKDKAAEECKDGESLKKITEYHGTGGTRNVERQVKQLICEICEKRGIADVESIYSKFVSMYDGDTDYDVKDVDFSDVNSVWSEKICVIYNQTVSVGISYDVTDSRFTDVFGIFQGMWNYITPESTVQSLFRIRSVQRMHLAVKCRSKEEWMRCKNPPTTARDIANFIFSGQVLYNNIAESSADIIAPSKVIDVINSASSIPYGAEECKEYIINQLGSNITTYGWMYYQLSLGRGMIDPVGCIGILLSSAGVQVEKFEDVNDAEENEKFIATNRELQERFCEEEFIKLRNIVESLLNGSYSDDIKYAEFEDIVLGNFRQEIDSDSMAMLISDDNGETRNWRKNEKDLVSIAFASIYNPDGEDITNLSRRTWIRYCANRVKTSRTYNVAKSMQKCGESKLGSQTRRSIVLQDGTAIMDVYIGMILGNILGYNYMEVEDRVDKVIERDSLLGGQHDDLINMLAGILISRNYSIPVGYTVRKSRITSFNLNSVKQILGVLNFYLQFIGASISVYNETNHMKSDNFIVSLKQLRATKDEIADRKSNISAFVRQSRQIADQQVYYSEGPKTEEITDYMPIIFVGGSMYKFTNEGLQKI